MSLLLTCLTLALRAPPPPAALLARAARSGRLHCCEGFTDRYTGTLPDWLLARTEALGFSTPTPVQASALPPLLEGRDALVIAQTGSGKTLTYLLPVIASLRPASSVQALVICPTRELAGQVSRVARRLAAAAPERLLVMALLDGSGAKRQRKWLNAQPPQLVIGNVQQVESVLQARLMKLSSLRHLIIDEVDACLADTSSSAALTRMLSGELAYRAAAAASSAAAERGVVQAPRQPRQTVFASATLPQRQHFRRQCKQQRWCREEPLLIHAQPDEPVPSQLRHAVAVVAPSKRLAALRVLLKQQADVISAAIVFVKPSRPLDKVAAALAGTLEAAAPAILSEDATLNQRAEALRGLREGRARLLLSTPLGARGLDIPHCSHVFLFDLPSSSDDYVHAAGRCGRMGRPGKVTVLCAEQELFVLRRIANPLGIVDFEDARAAAIASTSRKDKSQSVLDSND